ncbi:MATE family efflux transporter [Francisella sp. Scap27]|uniref:MATE family efflux transporter n=1 Tax=Francisella sp. Scap27 TaxID=2589986 RepID=UPI0015B902AA|nr:MATE family efflux transporter [Francisella sp. Scap27]QLE79633.1 MATE family efflux transporter [Francisella sp. Scap27]
MHKKIFLLSLPLMLSNTTLPIVGMINTALIGHLHSSSYLAATGLGVSVITVICFLFAFFRMSITGLVAQTPISDDRDTELAVLVMRASIVAIILSILVYIIKPFILLLLLNVIDVDNEVKKLFIGFYSIGIYTLWFALLNYIFIGFFIGIKHTKVVLKSSLILMASGISFSLIFVKVYDLNVIGIALSLVFSYFINFVFLSVVACRYFSAKGVKFNQVIYKADFLKLSEYTPFLKLNTNIFIRSVCLLLAFNSFYLFSSHYGKDVLAANTILMEVGLFVALFLDALANVTESLVASAYVEKSQNKFNEIINKTFIQCIAIAFALTCFYGIFSEQIIGLFTSIESVKIQINNYIIFSIALPLVASFSFWIDGVFVGLLKTTVMRNAMILSAIVYLLSVYLLSDFQNYGLWVSLLIFYVARTVFLYLPLKVYLKKSFFAR